MSFRGRREAATEKSLLRSSQNPSLRSKRNLFARDLHPSSKRLRDFSPPPGVRNDIHGNIPSPTVFASPSVSLRINSARNPYNLLMGVPSVKRTLSLCIAISINYKTALREHGFICINTCSWITAYPATGRLLFATALARVPRAAIPRH